VPGESAGTAHPEPRRCRAELPEEFRLRGDEHLAPMRDSFAEFFNGAYAGYKWLAGVKALSQEHFALALLDVIVDQAAQITNQPAPGHDAPLTLAGVHAAANICHRAGFIVGEALPPALGARGEDLERVGKTWPRGTRRRWMV
jgi:hypothetical protein